MKKYIFIFIFLAVIFSSCHREVSVERTIWGKVILKAEEKDIGDDYSGVKVKILGTKLEAETDFNGYYEIKNVPSGNYDIQFSKQGYSTYTLRSVLIIGGATYRKKIVDERYRNIELLEKPTTKITSFSLEVDTVGISVNATVEVSKQHVMLLLSKIPEVSDSLFMDWYPFYVDENQNVSGTISFELVRHYFVFEAGDTIYAVMYPAHTYAWGEPINATYLRAYGLGYNHSEIIQFVVPNSFHYKNLPLTEEQLATKEKNIR